MYHDNSGLETLLELNDQILDQEDGFWIKIEAWRVPRSESVPHGVRYCLTLHDRYGCRVLGYDNAHGVKETKRFRYGGHRYAFDHVHRHARDKGVPYHFQTAYQLLTDFFNDVDRTLKEIKNI